MSNIISPSILSADFCSLGDEIASVGSAPWLHIDVMDGHFVPNITIGIPVVFSIRKKTDKFLDVHLMIENPSIYVKPFCDAGADLICFHIESTEAVDTVLDAIKRCGKKAAIAINPKTPIRAILPYLDQIYMVLIMTVEPGYGGQRFMPEVLPKISELKRAITQKGLSVLIQVDGGINENTAARCVKEGANVLAAGSSIFGCKAKGAQEAQENQITQENSISPNDMVERLAKIGS